MDWMEQQGWLDTVSNKIQPLIQKTFQSSDTGWKVMDFLHGVWLGHPLHAVLTDIPIGAYTAAATMDVLELATGEEAFGAGADAAVALGISGAAGSAVTGLTDWQHTVGHPRRAGMLHALLNTSALALYAASFVCRKQNDRGSGRALSFLGFAATLAAGYLGGHLAYDEKIGVNHAPLAEDLPGKFTPVMAEEDLDEGKLVRADMGDVPVLLLKRDGQIFAIAETCAHLGGPLSEGKLFDDNSVACPWHGSRFSLEDGHLINGPSTYPETCFETRIRNGQIEVRPVKE
jgi:nitrite reductase/ring-hydroxylating ferredoxin subunit/uncharacterized membrane protein